MFRGAVVPDQAFPYPEVLTPDQKETLEMLVSPTEKFFVECNDPAKNDAEEKVADDTMEGLKAMGAFGLQVLNYLVCSCRLQLDFVEIF